MKPYALGHIAWRSTPPPLTRDIDGIADDRILAILSASTLTPIEQCRATTLASYEGVLFESHQPLGRTTWIMPLGGHGIGKSCGATELFNQAPSPHNGTDPQQSVYLELTVG